MAGSMSPRGGGQGNSVPEGFTLSMALMAWLASHLDGRDAKAKRKEQAVNAISQLCIMLAIVL